MVNLFLKDQTLDKRNTLVANKAIKHEARTESSVDSLPSQHHQNHVVG